MLFFNVQWDFFNKCHKLKENMNGQLLKISLTCTNKHKCCCYQTWTTRIFLSFPN